MKGRLVIFCGIPGSGKTTIAKLVSGSLKKSILIQTDAVRSMLAHPDFSGDESRFVYDACFGIAREALQSGYDVLVDGTFMREDYRAEARRLLRRHYSRVDTVFVKCGVEKALERNARRSDPVPPEKVKSISERFEVPGACFLVDSTRLSPEEAAGRVITALRRG